MTTRVFPRNTRGPGFVIWPPAKGGVDRGHAIDRITCRLTRGTGGRKYPRCRPTSRGSRGGTSPIEV
ncbi:MAG: hypothetical protein Ct9H300mP1_25880 [Planctomycetaceae bacterium]|nr:MAG: hypothetical protein Ct9H300mP1_25880 [Planctomycetaceae bacterium]